MPAQIKASEFQWNEPIHIRFGFSGFDSDQANHLIKNILATQWPAKKRISQCVYVVRLHGAVSVSYGEQHSPVVYVGEGSPYNRLRTHSLWMAELLASVPNAEVMVHVGKVSRKNETELYKYIEADMIHWFCEEYGYLPWFNRQRETSKEAQYEYTPGAKKELKRYLHIGKGTSYQWAIRPTHNNAHYSAYSCNGSKSRD